MAREKLVIALGGNTLLRASRKFSIHQELENVERACAQLARIARKGNRMVITHGNGPQVGDIMIQQQFSRHIVPAMPLDVCGAQTQGEIGYLLQRSLRGKLPGRGIVTILTQTLVSGRDPAFRKPTKFIGPFFRHIFPGARKDSVRGFRRVVPSPEPLEIIEAAEIGKLADLGFIVIAAGGGGIPVVRKRGKLEGVEAVVDKDLASEILATSMRADTLLMLTDVDSAWLDYGKRSGRRISRSSPKEMGGYLSQGHFPEGSMGPKVRAAIRFVEKGGRRAVITSPERAVEALQGRAGTTITK
jgi:carbamate kinase